MRVALLALMLSVGCKSDPANKAKEKAKAATEAVENTAKSTAKAVGNTAKAVEKTAKNATNVTTRSFKLGTVAQFRDGMKALCNAIPDDGKRHSKDEIDTKVKEALFKQPNPEVLTLWDSTKDLDPTSRYRNILMEVGRAELESCHLLELLGFD